MTSIKSQRSNSGISSGHQAHIITSASGLLSRARSVSVSQLRATARKAAANSELIVRRVKSGTILSSDNQYSRLLDVDAISEEHC